jgi:hypothetical protein
MIVCQPVPLSSSPRTTHGPIGDWSLKWWRVRSVVKVRVVARRITSSGDGGRVRVRILVEDSYVRGGREGGGGDWPGDGSEGTASVTDDHGVGGAVGSWRDT